jgi:hypothetical protein
MANAQKLAELSGSAIGQVELDRLLLDAVRRAIEPDHAPTLNQLPMATNDNQLAWPLIPSGGLVRRLSWAARAR